MNTMNMPGFTAEWSLSKPCKYYQEAGVVGNLAARGKVLPQLPTGGFIDCFKNCHDKEGHGPIFCAIKCSGGRSNQLSLMGAESFSAF